MYLNDIKPLFHFFSSGHIARLMVGKVVVVSMHGRSDK